MIELTRLNGTTFVINSDLIETIEETPDTVIVLTIGTKALFRRARGDRRQGRRVSSQDCVALGDSGRLWGVWMDIATVIGIVGGAFFDGAVGGDGRGLAAGF